MSVTHCTLPWTWLVLDEDGNSRPCCQSPGAFGRLREQKAEDLWNGPEMTALRRSMAAGVVPPVCQGAACTPVQAQAGRIPPMTGPRPVLDPEFARRFDDADYLARHPDVANAVALRESESGLDHYLHFGRGEGRGFRLHDSPEGQPLTDSHRALLEFSSGQVTVSVTPRNLVIGVTTVCNLACVMCPHGIGGIKEPRHLDVSYAEKLEGFISRATRVELVGIGEPMLAPVFWRIVDLARRYPQAYLRTNSNGHLLNAAAIERLLDSTFSELSLSLDAASAETYRRIRGADFERVKQNIRSLCRRQREKGNTRLDVTINCVMMRSNVHELVAFAELAAELGVRRVVYSELAAMPNAAAWSVQRPGWRFDYQREMLPEGDETARDALRMARDRCSELGLRSHFIQGTHRRML